ncbi:LysM peptidoglycan-binding domain-containing protein [candidate division WOR-3 bacterium]|nr:LysM peptidoglycan-binding domain-containing protein [candidate division WOR-3 bacterium]
MKRIISLVFVFCLLIPVVANAQEKLTEKDAQAMLVALQEQLAEAEAQLSAIEAEYEALKSEVTALQGRRDDLAGKLAGLKEEWKMCQYGRYKVIEGDWLSKIASMRKVYHNGSKWPMIYEANKDKIKNPNLIYPGWVLLVPTLDQYEVVSGDALYLIASYLSIYSSARRWPEIYEANKEHIKDPDLIYPKQVFTVPH